MCDSVCNIYCEEYWGNPIVFFFHAWEKMWFSEFLAAAGQTENQGIERGGIHARERYRTASVTYTLNQWSETVKNHFGSFFRHLVLFQFISWQNYSIRNLVSIQSIVFVIPLWSVISLLSQCNFFQMFELRFTSNSSAMKWNETKQFEWNLWNRTRWRKNEMNWFFTVPDPCFEEFGRMVRRSARHKLVWKSTAQCSQNDLVILFGLFCWFFFHIYNGTFSHW